MTGRTDAASRIIRASAEDISRAFLDPQMLMQWLPPNGMSGRALIFEPWQGGRYRIELRYDSAVPPGGIGKSGDRSDISAGRFIALEPGRQITQSVQFESGDPAFAGEMIVSWAFVSVGEGTEVTVTAEGVPPGISAEDHAAGLASSLANLADFVEAG